LRTPDDMKVGMIVMDEFVELGEVQGGEVEYEEVDQSHKWSNIPTSGTFTVTNSKLMLRFAGMYDVRYDAVKYPKIHWAVESRLRFGFDASKWSAYHKGE
jgi:hypothetical protein